MAGARLLLVGDMADGLQTTLSRFVRENGDALQLTPRERRDWRAEIATDLATAGVHKGGGGAAGAYALCHPDKLAEARAWAAL